MEGSVLLDHVALATSHLRHVDFHPFYNRAEMRCVPDDMGDLRAPYLVLCRHAGDS